MSNFIDRILLPVICLFLIIKSVYVFNDHAVDLLYFLRSLLTPIVILVLLLSSAKPKLTRLSAISIVGIVLSYSGFLFVEPNRDELPRILVVLSLANSVFYATFGLFGYLSLGRNLGIVPALRSIVSRGAYQVVRHPIYSSYIHLLLTYFAINPNSKNFLALTLVSAGLFIRAHEEEKILAYLDYARSVPGMFFHFYLSIPAIVLCGFCLSHQLRASSQEPSAVRLQFAHPPTSISPLVYDDWSSIFLGNHIYPRLLPENDRKNIAAIASDFQIVCEDLSEDIHSCARVRVSFSTKGFSDCQGRNYSADDLKAEFFDLLAKKSWVFPNFRACSELGAAVCVTGDNIPDLKRMFQNVYFRFGWSKAAANDSRYGVGPYCLTSETSRSGTFKSGRLTPRDSGLGLPIIDYSTSNDTDSNFNIALYGTSSLVKGDRLSVMTHTPLGYYAVTNYRIAGSAPWNLPLAQGIIKNHLLSTGVVYPSDNIFAKLLPSGRANVSLVYSKKRKSSGHLRFILPNYLPDCELLSHRLNDLWRDSGADAQSVCGNTSLLVEKIANNKFEDWSGFLTPLSPGAPGRSAIQNQYFSNESPEAWTGKTKDADEFYYRVGVGRSSVIVDGQKFCGLNPNSLGLGDVFITDFTTCD